MSVILTLDLPWVEDATSDLPELSVRPGRMGTLAFDDGIVLEVHTLDPVEHHSARAMIEHAKAAAGPGRVVLVAGAVPVEWRADLRNAGVSFLDVSGVAEIEWPRLRVSARHFGRFTERRRESLPLQQGHVAVTQELLIVAIDGSRPTIGELAESAGVGLATASRAVSQLAEHGLVTKEREGTRVLVTPTDRIELAERLAERSAWPKDGLLSGYLWGRTIFDVAANLSKAAKQEQIDLAVTGRVAAAYYGVLGTASPAAVRCWLGGTRDELPDLAERLGLEPVEEESANVLVCPDPRRVGVHRRRDLELDRLTATVAHPLRVWCDVRSESRGLEFAAQLWGVVTDGR